jgi:hypothetical protein
MTADLYRVNLPLTTHFKHLQDSGGHLSPCKHLVATESLYHWVRDDDISHPVAIEISDCDHVRALPRQERGAGHTRKPALAAAQQDGQAIRAAAIRGAAGTVDDC